MPESTLTIGSLFSGYGGLDMAVEQVTGVSGLTRAQQLKAIGNGVCPQQAVAALQELLNREGASNG